MTLRLLLFLVFASPLLAHGQSLTGFAPNAIADQLACEARLQDLPASEAFRAHLQELTKEPHIGATPANDRVGDYIAQVMEAAGLTVTRYPYDVYLPSGKDTEIDVALVTPIRLPLNNQEYILPEDRFSSHPELLQGWNAFSGSGDVMGEVVYANYGRKEDFELLARMGISVQGKVVIARYGGNFRGYKAHYAEQYGAVGLVIYSDPANGGFTRGAPYPEGRQISESTIQRGSLLTLPYTGDPLTPFEPALPGDDTKRLKPEEIVDLHTIPVAPLPYGSAQEILSRMDGDIVPQGWQGGLPFSYRVTGGSDLTVRVRVDQPHGLRRATNIVGTVPGTDHPDEWVMLGSHYDAWNFGAVDPNGGTAMLLTLAETLGQLAENGCAPRRSIRIAHWDVEEFGIIGSAEWVEQFRDELTEGGVMYLNADAAVSGPNFGGSSSPSLKGLIEDATKAVMYPGTEQTLYEWWAARAQRGGNDTPSLGNLGGGSDHVGFYTHIGVPSAGLSMGGSSPIYHSNYDNFAWYERFGDKDFVFGPTLARLDGIIALRLANATLLPYDVVRYATDLRRHVTDLSRRGEIAGLSMGFDTLLSSIDALEAAATTFVARRDAAIAAGLSEASANQINAQLIALEKAFISEAGLQDRPWSRSLYASPDPFSGYASWMLPGLRYEIETRNGPGLEQWLRVYVQATDDLAENVRTLSAAME
ncbi:MAG: transferrin receptor-like dimerization domain-containing protein [Rhodothermales bacterium]